MQNNKVNKGVPETGRQWHQRYNQGYRPGAWNTEKKQEQTMDIKESLGIRKTGKTQELSMDTEYSQASRSGTEPENTDGTRNKDRFGKRILTNNKTKAITEPIKEYNNMTQGLLLCWGFSLC